MAEKTKKYLRGDDGIDINTWRKDLKLEIGDLFFYILMLCNEYDMSLDEIVALNKQKLKSRKLNGTINGSGDYR
jgi:NTP pyrophosphatase (non-canonical NTP hydrolase)